MPTETTQKDYPISRALTSPLGKGVASTLVTAGSMLAIKKALGSEAAKRVAKKFGKSLKATGPTTKQVVGTSAFSGALSALFANVERDIYAKALEGKIRSGRGGFTSQERKLLVGKRVPKGKGGISGFSEYYVTPRTHALGRAALGALLGGTSGAITEGLSGGVGTAVNRRIWARALAGRAAKGKKLTTHEKRLLQTLRQTQ